MTCSKNHTLYTLDIVNIFELVKKSYTLYTWKVNNFDGTEKKYTKYT